MLAKDIHHPGACHLYVHATESTVVPGRAEACAEFLGRSIPGASHINHMPSHTWNEVGRWGDSVRANLEAWHSDLKAAVGEGFAIYPEHNLHMLLYRRVVRRSGRDRDARREGLREADRRHVLPGADADAVRPLRRGARGDEPAEDRTSRAGLWDFAQGYAQLKLGDADFAQLYLGAREEGGRDVDGHVPRVTARRTCSASRPASSKAKFSGRRGDLPAAIRRSSAPLCPGRCARLRRAGAAAVRGAPLAGRRAARRQALRRRPRRVVSRGARRTTRTTAGRCSACSKRSRRRVIVDGGGRRSGGELGARGHLDQNVAVLGVRVANLSSNPPALLRCGVVLSMVLLSAPAMSAHMFLQPYILPVPFWMYLYGCAATLVLSFALVGYFSRLPATTPKHRTWDLLPATDRAQTAWLWVLRVLRAGALVCLLLTLISGLVGTGDPRANINMTLFWVGFLLAFTYATALLGDLFALVNPWRTLVDLIEALGIDLSMRRVSYPNWLGYLPAFGFYVALIWLELFVLPRPYTLSVALVVYTSAMIAGAGLFGKRTWFTHGDMFSVFFRLVGLMAPIEYGRAEEGRAQIRLRRPFMAACLQPPMHLSLVLFVLFMLASTTYDAIHQTFFWVSIYWQRILPALRPLWGGDIAAAQAELIRWYQVYQYAGLILSPFLYLLVFILVLGCARLVTRTAMPLGTLAGMLAPTVVPIALVYHAAHYSTILITEFPRLLPMAADPLGAGWQLFSAGTVSQRPLNMGLLWHTQVALMLGGHVLGVYLAHTKSLRLFTGAWQGVVSQVPMLVLMVAYTCVGLWVLSLPLDVPQVIPLE